MKPLQLYIQFFKGFPATALSRCSNLIDPQLEELELAPPEVHQVISRRKIPTPVSLYAKQYLCIDSECLSLSVILQIFHRGYFSGCVCGVGRVWPQA